MNISFKGIKWLRVIISAFAVVAVSFFIITIITTAYAFLLAFETHGKPDHYAIGYFAGSISKWLMPLLEAFFAFFTAMFLAKKVDGNIFLHGLLIGSLVGVLNAAVKIYFVSRIDYQSIFFLLIVSGIGGAGGSVGKRRSNKNLKPSE